MFFWIFTKNVKNVKSVTT